MTKTSNKLILAVIAVLMLLVTAFGVIVTPTVKADASTPADIKVKVSDVSNMGGLQNFETTETVDGETFSAYCVIGGGFVKLLTLDKAYDVSEIFNTNKGALTFYVYIGSEDCLTRHKKLTGDWLIDVCSSEEFDDSHKYTFKINDLFKDCQIGWNKIELPFLCAAQKISTDFTSIKHIRFNCNGCTLYAATDCNFKFGNFTFTTTEKTVMSATPYEEKKQDVAGNISAWFKEDTGVKLVSCSAVVLLVVLIVVVAKRKKR